MPDEVSSSPMPDLSQGLVGAKVASMALLGGVALVCSTAPVLLTRKCSSLSGGKLLDYLLRLGGGILLATTFLHLLPEVREGLEDLDLDWTADLPVQLPELLMCLGFFLMYGIEEVAHRLLGHSHGHTDPEKSSVLHDDHRDPLLLRHERTLTMSQIKREFLQLPSVRNSGTRSSFDSDEEDLFSKVEGWSGWLPSQDEMTHILLPQASPPYTPEHPHPKGGELRTAGTPLRAILITLAISIHQVFEGLAVGLETHTQQVWILTGAIAAHKAVIAICVGAESASSPLISLIGLLGSFALATPLGIGLGLAISSGPGLTSVLLQGLAAGTLLFVVFFEVLQRSPSANGGGSNIAHFLLTALGFGLMLTLLCFFQS